jgi:hypothetical protein
VSDSICDVFEGREEKIFISDCVCDVFEGWEEKSQSKLYSLNFKFIKHMC